MGLTRSKHLNHLNCQPGWPPERIQLELESKIANMKLQICRYEKRRRGHDLEIALEYRRAVTQMKYLLDAIHLAQHINSLNYNIDAVESGKTSTPGHAELIRFSHSIRDANEALAKLTPETISWLSKSGILHMTPVPQKMAPVARPHLIESPEIQTVG